MVNGAMLSMQSDGDAFGGKEASAVRNAAALRLVTATTTGPALPSSPNLL